MILELKDDSTFWNTYFSVVIARKTKVWRQIDSEASFMKSMHVSPRVSTCVGAVSLARSLVPRSTSLSSFAQCLCRIEDDAKITKYLSIEVANGGERKHLSPARQIYFALAFRVECIRYEEFFILRPSSIEQCFFCLNYAVAPPPWDCPPSSNTRCQRKYYETTL